MVIHFSVAILFAITVFLALAEERLKDTHKLIILAGYAMVMILLATTKSVENTADALNYEEMFLYNDDVLTELATEPTYIYLSRLVLALGGGLPVVFFVYALISSPVKLRAISRITPYTFTALLIYLPVYFELQDMIQIRTGAAAAFLMTSLIPLSEGRRWRAALLMVCAFFFHYSSLVYFPFLLLGNRQLGLAGRIVVAALLPVCFAMYFLKMDLFSLIPSSLVDGKLDFYKSSSEEGQWNEILTPTKNLYFLAKCSMLYFCLYFYDPIVKQQRMAPLLINLFAMSIFFMLTMATVPVVGSRISDLYGIIDCVVFTFLLYIISPAYVARSAIALLGLYMLVYNMLFTEYFT